ncbi:unnamed protein product [Pleuronectes platessa]|uniref:Uncharacterized protein n=1 Tax=Pleuronectes platessa TaxID=8262 RepID=A0A9N7UVW6_PLEPL|nr:unnamed protein product [Pleuronectes platessa]
MNANTEVKVAECFSNVAPSPSSLRRRRLSVRHREVLIRWHLTAPARKASCWRGLGTRSAAATLDACRALLADHLSYGDRWGNPLFARGGHPAVRLGLRLAAD